MLHEYEWYIQWSHVVTLGGPTYNDYVMCMNLRIDWLVTFVCFSSVFCVIKYGPKHMQWYVEIMYIRSQPEWIDCKWTIYLTIFLFTQIVTYKTNPYQYVHNFTSEVMQINGSIKLCNLYLTFTQIIFIWKLTYYIPHSNGVIYASGMFNYVRSFQIYVN